MTGWINSSAKPIWSSDSKTLPFPNCLTVFSWIYVEQRVIERKTSRLKDIFLPTTTASHAPLSLWEFHTRPR